MEQQQSLKACDTNVVCPICGAEEPFPWFEQPMNEEIRAYARAYIGPPKKFNTSLQAELDDWGIVITPEEV